jgi:SRSO17 transposase
VQGVRELKKWYVLDISSDAYLWLAQPELGEPGPRGGRAKPKTKPISAAQAAASLPSSSFKRITVSQGSQGSIVYEYAELWVWFSEEGYPAESAERFLVRRSLKQDGELKHHRSNAPRKVGLQRVAEQRACRWTIEEDIKAGKGQCGLDEYETRGWIGWHHHTVLSMLALLFLVLQKQRRGKKEPQMTVPEVRALLRHLLDLRQRDEDEIVAWSNWRMERNRIAKECHAARRREQLRRRSRKKVEAL